MILIVVKGDSPRAGGPLADLLGGEVGSAALTGASGCLRACRDTAQNDFAIRN